MHAEIDAFTAIARSKADTADRVERIEAALFDHLASRIEAHGFAGDRERIHMIIGMDAKLNAQGLDVWLSRQERVT
jgi:hypothetical protein